MDPIPSTSRVFSFVIQEEKQRFINSISINNSETLAYAINDANGSKSKSVKKDRPLCSHCGMQGHIKDKSYKIHGYPPWYKKGKPTTQQSANDVHLDTIEDMPFNTKQYQQLIA